MRVELAKVTKEMLPALSELHTRSWQVAYRGIVPDAYLDALSAEKRLARWLERLPYTDNDQYAIMADGQIVGLSIQGASRDMDEQAGEIEAFYLHPDAWGKGYAQPAMQLALERLQEAGFQTVILWVLEQNARARRFYERAGFAPDGARKQIAIGGVGLWEVRYRQDVSRSNR